MAPTSATSPTAGETAGDSTDGTKASTAKATEAETSKDATNGGVRVEFVGVPPYGREFHGERSIDSAAWRRAGVDANKMVWNGDNGWTVEVDGSNEALLSYFKNANSGFKVHE